MAVHTFEGTYIEKDEYGCLWVKNQAGEIVCEAFYQTDDQSFEDMLDAGYIPVPYEFEGESVFVEVVPD